ncbi:MAG: TnpV protein [Clostridia bacterium]|nr:TnpV protein [Acutalibacteraceae bacterium]MEE1047155.1 TnpV protein [Clostridia bacterium]
MEKFIYDENNGLWYELQGDYYIPCLKLPDEEQKEIGIWGMRHLEYLKHHRKATYNCLQAEFKLNSYLYDINSQAENLFENLVKELKQSEGITEQLKAENQMEWVARMNNIRQRAAEIVNKEMIYT